jgi:HD-like signal output (HDOD) protein
MGQGNNTGKHRADYGRGEYQIDAPDLLLTPEAMVAHLRRTLVSPSYKPPLLPSIALDLMRLTRQPDVSLAEVRTLLERDALLAAKVLQLAQSALYSRGAPVRSLHEAISRLGLRTLGDLFLQTVLSMRVFRADGYDAPMATLMRHSTVTAHVARIACRMTALPDEYAFMCGLLHDAGLAAGLLIFADAGSAADTQRAPRSTRQEPRVSGGPAARAGRPATPLPERPSYEELSAALDAVHEEASSILAEAWKLNPDIRMVIGSHHHVRINGRVHPLAAVVCVSDWIASEAGARMGSESDQTQAQEAARELRFTRANLDEPTAKAREIIDLA